MDVIDRLQAVVDDAADLRVRGSQGQPVSLPELAELRQYRSLLASLLKALALPDTEELAAVKQQHLDPTSGAMLPSPRSAMPNRRGVSRSSTEALADAVPEQFLDLRPYLTGGVDGSATTWPKLARWLKSNGSNADALPEVIRCLGVDVSTCYRVMLSRSQLD